MQKLDVVSRVDKPGLWIKTLIDGGGLVHWIELEVFLALHFLLFDWRYDPERLNDITNVMVVYLAVNGLVGLYKVANSQL